MQLSFWVDVYVTHIAVMWLVSGGGVDGWPFRAGRGTGWIHISTPFLGQHVMTPQHPPVLRTYNRESIRQNSHTLSIALYLFLHIKTFTLCTNVLKVIENELLHTIILHIISTDYECLFHHIFWQDSNFWNMIARW